MLGVDIIGSHSGQERVCFLFLNGAICRGVSMGVAEKGIELCQGKYRTGVIGMDKN